MGKELTRHLVWWVVSGALGLILGWAVWGRRAGGSSRRTVSRSLRARACSFSERVSMYEVARCQRIRPVAASTARRMFGSAVTKRRLPTRIGEALPRAGIAVRHATCSVFDQRIGGIESG